MEIVTNIAPIALALIMLGLGLGLTIQDFKRVITTPKDFSIGISYDLNVSSYKEASKMNGGAEISLKYHLLKGALFKQKNMF